VRHLFLLLLGEAWDEVLWSLIEVQNKNLFPLKKTRGRVETDSTEVPIILA